MWWICASSGTLSKVGYSRSSGANAGEDHITYPCAMLTIYHYDTKIRYHRKDFLCHEGCFIIAHQLRYRRTSLEENRHLEIIHVILSAAKDLASLPKRSKARAQDDRQAALRACPERSEGMTGLTPLKPAPGKPFTSTVAIDRHS